MTGAVSSRILALLLAAALSLAPMLARAASPVPANEGAGIWGAGVWDSWKQHFLGGDGRVTDDANKGVSHTEGQGYGMLLAVFANDRAAFEKIWGFASRELYLRKDGLGAWKYVPDATPHVPDQNNATDGDLLIAWALAEAGKAWKEPKFIAAAKQIALAIGRNALASSSYGPVIKPGAVGFGVLDSEDGPVVNLSYWVYPAFDALKAVAPDVNWQDLRASGLALTQAARLGPAQLPPDWLSLRQIQPQAAKNFPAVFGYNAIRVPLYLAWAGLADADRLAPFAVQWRKSEQKPSVIDIATGRATEPMDDLGYQAVAALTRCAADGQKLPDELRLVRPDHYYSTTLHMLSLLAMRQRFPQCL